MSDTRPALEYLVACSDMSLESFQISRMNQAANLRRQVRALVDQWIEAEVDAVLSRWMLEFRRTDAATPTLRLDYSPRNKSPEHVAISFRPGRIELSEAATRQQRLTTGPAEGGGARAFPLLGNGIAVSEDCKNAVEGPARKMRKPYAKPLARTYLASSSEAAGAIVMPVGSRLKAQHELKFEVEAPFVSGLEAEETPEAAVLCAAAGGSSLPSERPLHQVSRSLAEADAGQMTRCMRPCKTHSSAFSIRPCLQSESSLLACDSDALLVFTSSPG
jgi:hypothetical protein